MTYPTQNLIGGELLENNGELNEDGLPCCCWEGVQQAEVDGMQSETCYMEDSLIFC